MKCTTETNQGLHPKDVLLPLIGALWACATLLFSVTTHCNSIRDRVILGRDGTMDIPMSHRVHLMHSDWLPYALLVTLVCVGFSTLAACTPRMVSNAAQRSIARPIAIFVSVGTAVMALAWVPSAFSDWFYMRDTLQSAQVSAQPLPKAP